MLSSERGRVGENGERNASLPEKLVERARSHGPNYRSAALSAIVRRQKCRSSGFPASCLSATAGVQYIARFRTIKCPYLVEDTARGGLSQ
jgi:hypothetical protein